MRAHWACIRITGNVGVYALCDPARVHVLHLDDRWPKIKLENFRNLRELTLLSGCSHLQLSETTGAKLARLERLTVSSGATIPRLVAHLRGLRELVVHGNINNKSLRSIGLLSQLRHLELNLSYQVDATDHGFRHLTALTNLRTFRLKSMGQPIVPELWDQILSSNLRTLELPRLLSAQYYDRIAVRCPLLEDLTFVTSRPPPPNLLNLTRLVRLCVDGDFQLFDLGPLNATLRGLTLRNLSLASLTSVGRLHELEELSLELQSSLFDASALENLGRLRTFHLESSGLSDEHLRFVSRLHNLRELRLAGGNWNGCLTDAGLIHLRELHQLQKLTLRNCSMSQKGLAHLAFLSNLRFVHLHSCAKLTLSALRTVSWPALERLDLYYLDKTRRARVGRVFAQAQVACFPE